MVSSTCRLKYFLVCSVVIAPIFLAISIWALVEKVKFMPFYSPIECTGVYGFFRNDKIIQKTGAKAGWLNVVNLPTFISCSNPNEYDFTVGAASTAQTYMQPEALDMPADPRSADDDKREEFLFPAGNMVFFEEMVVKSKEKNIPLRMGLTWQLQPKYVTGFTNWGIGLMTQAKEARFLFLFELHFIASVKVDFMGYSQNEENLVPTFYCGLWLVVIPPDMTNGTRGFPIPEGAVETDSGTKCRKSMKEAIRDTKVLPPGSGPKKQMDTSDPQYIIDNFDPLPEKLVELKSKFDKTTGGVVCFSMMVVIFSFFIGCACWKCKCAEDAYDKAYCLSYAHSGEEPQPVPALPAPKMAAIKNKPEERDDSRGVGVAELMDRKPEKKPKLDQV